MSLFEVHRGPRGRFLVRDGSRRFAVPAPLGHRLQRPDGLEHWRQLVARPDRPAAAGPRLLWLRLTLLPARVVRPLAGLLAPLTAWPMLLALVVNGVLGMLLAPVPRGMSLTDALPAAGVFLVTAIWHELGHAAALRREGWPPGAVGVGLLVAWPVLWTDVSATTLLPRRGRVRVDVAGVCFQLGLAGLVGVVSSAVGWSGGGLVVRAVVVAVVWSLLPLVRSDGHWLVCDLVGLPDLAAAPPPGRPRGVLGLLAAWRVVTMTAVVLLLVSLPWRVWRLMSRWDGLDDGVRPLVLAGLAVVLVLAAWRAARRLAQLGRALWRDGFCG